MCVLFCGLFCGLFWNVCAVYVCGGALTAGNSPCSSGNMSPSSAGRAGKSTASASSASRNRAGVEYLRGGRAIETTVPNTRGLFFKTIVWLQRPIKQHRNSSNHLNVDAEAGRVRVDEIDHGIDGGIHLGGIGICNVVWPERASNQSLVQPPVHQA